LVEIDAATSSGKEDIRKIREDAEYGAFGGSRKIYLIDESHELSRQAMDALLKPLEDTFLGSLDKRLVCIFCTTEPAKMRSAIMSRCAPAFRIHPNSPKQIRERLEKICAAEGISADPAALELIAEVKESHIRDCLKAVEALATRGDIGLEGVREYLHLGASEWVLEALGKVGVDCTGISAPLKKLEETTSSSVAYEKFASLSLLAYLVSTNKQTPVPTFLSRTRLQEIGDRLGVFLVKCARTFSERPYRSTYTMLVCDLLYLDAMQRGLWVEGGSPKFHVSLPPAQGATETTSPMDVPNTPFVTETGVSIDPIARKRPTGHKATPVEESKAMKGTEISAESFSVVLVEKVLGATNQEQKSGSKGHTLMGDSRTDANRDQPHRGEASGE